jgi:hypothetical protein
VEARVPATVQEVHQVVLHLLCEAVEAELGAHKLLGELSR